MIIADPRGMLPEGQRYWTSFEQPSPIYTTQVVAQVFFGRSSSWLRQHLAVPDHVTDDEGCAIPIKGANGYFEWRLHDIERAAHALAHNRHIDGARMGMVITMVRTNAQLHGVLA